MTEHCINNGTSICQTEDATHLVVKYRDFTYNKTIGVTYSDMRMELMFHFTTDLESYDDRLILCVTSMSNRTWHIVLYDDPYDNNSNETLKVLLAKETLELYNVRDFEFNKRDELLIYFRIGEENIQLLEQVIEEEEMVRLYKCLESLYVHYEFSDMTVQDKWPAHRAVAAAASKVLDEAVSNLPFNKSATEDSNANRSTDLVQTEKNNIVNENGKEQETELQCLNSKILDEAVSNLPLSKNTTEDDDATTYADLVSTTTEKNKTDTENVKVQCLTNKSLDETIPILPHNKSALQDRDATTRTEEQETKTQQLASAIFAFIGSLNINTKDFPLGRLIKNVQDSLEEYVTSSADDDDEINFNKPESTNYILDLTGLTSSVANQLLCYIYTGDLYIDYSDDDEILNLLITAMSYKIDSLLSLLENKCIGLIRNRNVTVFLRYSQLFNLEKLRLEAIKRIRRLSFHNVANTEQDLFIHKCILSTPTHAFKTHGTFTINAPNISELKDYNSENIYICNMPLYVKLNKYMDNNVAYLSIYINVARLIKQWTIILKCDFAILNDKHVINEVKSFRHIFRRISGRGYPKFISWEDLINPNNGYVKNDAITIKVFVAVLDSWIFKNYQDWTDESDED